MFQSGGLSRGFPVLNGSGLTEVGAMFHPGVRGVFVRSTGRKDHDPRWLVDTGRFFASLPEAIAEMRSGVGDVINLLPGHVENIATADYLAGMKAGTKIIGWGSYADRPALTWSTATSTLLISMASINFANINMYMAGPDSGSVAITVAAPITVSAAGLGFYNCFMQVGVSATQLVGKAITGTDAATYLTFEGCQMFGKTAAACTTVLDILGSHYLRMLNTHIQAATTSTTVGVMRLNATGLLGGLVDNCMFANRKAASIHAVTGVAASAGMCKNSNFHILDAATRVGWQTKGDWSFHNCFTSNATGDVGVAMTQ